MITYNHENYIREAIEGVLMQKTNFPVGLVIGEDCSNDNTRQICQEYASKNSVINLLPSETNLGMMANFIRTFQACTGKYIALCEGDDYWLDPLKLQKQVDFLEENKKDVICTHSVLEIDENNKFTRILEPSIIKNEYTYRDINLNLTIWTCSVVFRNCLNEIPKWVQSLPAGDFPLWLLLSKYGNILYINEAMSVYRNNNSGIHSSLSRTKKIINGLVLVKKMKRYFPLEYQDFFKEHNKVYLNFLSNEINELSSQEKYSEARKSIFLMLKYDIMLKSLQFPKFKVMVNIIFGNKLWLFLMVLKGKRKL